MARREQAGGGSPRRGRSGGGRSSGHRGHSGRKRRGNRGARHSGSATRRATRAASQERGSSSAVGEHPAAGSVWHVSSAAGGGAEPLLTLTPGQARGQATLALVGAEQAALRDALQAWGAARDLAANRAWRRPGGLVRMAGL